MVAFEGGTFTMGATAVQGRDAYDNEKPARQVTLGGYRIGRAVPRRGTPIRKPHIAAPAAMWGDVIPKGDATSARLPARVCWATSPTLNRMYVARCPHIRRCAPNMGLSDLGTSATFVACPHVLGNTATVHYFNLRVMVQIYS